MLKLHAKHGPIVRISPNEIVIADPSAIKTIYGHKSGFTKVNLLLQRLFVRATGTIAGSIQMPEIEVFLLREMRKCMQHDGGMSRMRIQCRL